MYTCTVTMKDGKKYSFSAETASEALEKAEKEYSGYKKLTAEYANVTIDLGWFDVRASDR